jgi:hypothetical protein
VTDPNFSAIRARLRYESIDEFIDGYSRFISTGGMFIPMAPSKLKPVGTTIRFQFLLQDGATAMLGEGVVRQIQGADRDDNSPVGMLVKFVKLSRESKKIVQQAVARKGADQASTLAPDSDQLQAPPPETHTQAASDDIFANGDPEVPAADDAQTRDSEQGDTGVLEPDENEALNSMFLSPDGDDEEDAESASPQEAPDPVDTSEHIEDNASSDEHEAEELPAGDVPASGSDVFSEAEASEPGDAPSASDQPNAPGPKELGRTEAGLQIMAFDEVSDDEMADFDGFDFGGDEDEVDQMFEGIFGGGGGDDDDGDLFGGGGDDDGDFFGGDEDHGDDEDADLLLADGGTPIDPDSDALDTDSDALDTDSDALDTDSDALDTDSDALDTDSDAIDAPDESVKQTYDLDEEIDETYDLDEDFALVEESSQDVDEEASGEEFEQTYDLDDEIDLDDEEVELTDEIDLDDEDEFDLDGEDEFDLDGEDEFDLDGEDDDEAVAIGLAHEHSAPSSDLMSALGSLDSEGDDEELALSIGGDAEKEEEKEETEEEDAVEDDEESLESLLAHAKQDIDATRETEEDEKSQGDILDDLLGSDDELPPPPGNEPVFDLGDNEKKKKKGGFISKLFGKD